MGRNRDLIALLTARVNALETRQAELEAGMMGGIKASGGHGGGHGHGGGTQPPPATPPPLVISPVGTITVVAPAGSTSVAVSIPAPIVTGGTPPYTVRDTPASGSLFPVGSTTVTITVTDSGSPALVASESTSVVVVVDPVGAGSGSTITVADGGDLQEALDSAVAGDTITVAAGSTFDKITIPVFSGTDYVTLRTSTADATLPSVTTRATLAHASLMPTITSSTSDPAITFAAGAHHWRLIGLNIVDTIGLNDMVVIGTGLETSLADLPDNIIMDRCLMQGKTAGGTKRGLSLNASTGEISGKNVRSKNKTWSSAWLAM